jgi:cytochrome c oxidase subunit II
MDQDFSLFPTQASSIAPELDFLYFFLWAITAFFTVLIFALIIFFAIKYRRRDESVPPPIEGSTKLEMAWTIIPFVIVMVIFVWGARLFFHVYRPPDDALVINVVGKQWMWKLQHPDGKREINELHVPRGRPIRLMMASQDVLHSFYIPAFRVKQDVVPGRYSVTWFEPTKSGVYHLFCAEYCGTQHSGMIGRVVVMEPDEYQDWLTGTPSDQSPAEAGALLFTQQGCITCHGVQGPSLAGVFGSQVRLSDGRTVRADDEYLRKSILNSTDDLVEGFPPIMPSYRGQLSEEQVMNLVAYIKSLKDKQQMPATEPGGRTAAPTQGAGQAR